jgi:hypothetical protein
MRLVRNRAMWSRKVLPFISRGAPTQCANVRSPEGSISTAVVLVAPVGWVNRWEASSPSASYLRRMIGAHSSRPT